MNIKFHRAGDDVDIALFDTNGPVAAKYTVPLRALISALPEDLLNEFWRPQLDDALAQVDNLRAGLAETSRDADRIAEQRDEAREEAARLRAEVEQLQVRSNHVTTQRDEVCRQLAMMESQRSREIAEYDNQRRSIRALRRTIKELTS